MWLGAGTNFWEFFFHEVGHVVSQEDFFFKRRGIPYRSGRPNLWKSFQAFLSEGDSTNWKSEAGEFSMDKRFFRGCGNHSKSSEYFIHPINRIFLSVCFPIEPIDHGNWKLQGCLLNHPSSNHW